MKSTKINIFTLIFALIMVTALTACSNMKDTSNSTFPNIDDDDIPDILEKTVGTLGDTYYTSFGKSDNKDYSSYLAVKFKNTTVDDYTELTNHYKSASIETDEDGFLIFDWGRLRVIPNDGSITVDAFIK